MHRSIAAVLLLVLAGCSQATTVAMAPPGQDAAGKQFSPPPTGMGALYFYNPATQSPLLYVLVDGRTLSKLPLPDSLRAALEEGAAGRATDHAAYLPHGEAVSS